MGQNFSFLYFPRYRKRVYTASKGYLLYCFPQSLKIENGFVLELLEIQEPLRISSLLLDMLTSKILLDLLSVLENELMLYKSLL